jgi:hypothetical protein
MTVMTRLRLGSIALAACILPCVAAPAIAQPATPSYADRLARLDDLQRRAVLRGAVVNSGQRCGRVEIAAPRGRLRNLVMWAVRCTPGDDFGVFIGPDGSAQVRTCSDLAKLRLPTCRLAPRPAKAAPRAR